MTAAIRFSGVTRQFGSVRAIDNLTLDIAEGEFFALLGPSGSGKTTSLRLVAGFERPDAGSVSIFGQDVTATPPYRRPVNTVFQDYALFPHLDVRDNVAFGLRVAGVGRAERHRAALAALEMVKLPGHAGRKPSELSGGQRQRVALARALVNKPKVLLLDEPLGALDLKLREQMQEELRNLQRQLNITFVLVTHDQGEALSMADRVAVFSDGRLQQVGSPVDVYDRPATPFVADFVGSSNVLPAVMVARLTGRAHPASLRPERIRLADTGLAATVTGTSFLGSATRVFVTAEGARMSVLLPKGAVVPATGAAVRLDWDADALHLMTGPADG